MLPILPKIVTFAREHWRAIAVVLALAVAFPAGRCSVSKSPERVESQENTREREHTEQTVSSISKVEQTASAARETKQERHVVIVHDVDVRADGSRHEHTVTASASTASAQEHDLLAAARATTTTEHATSTRSAEAERKTITTKGDAPRVEVDVLLGTRILPFKFPPDPLLGVQVKGRVGELPLLNLPVSVGVFGLTDLQFKAPIVGVSGGVAF